MPERVIASIDSVGESSGCGLPPGRAQCLLQALVQASSLDAIVPLVIAIVERDPLASAGCFAGDLLRGLMSVPSHFWSGNTKLYERYRASLRAGALARRKLPYSQRMAFWSDHEPVHADSEPEDATGSRKSCG
jgi:hypothetical protein